MEWNAAAVDAPAHLFSVAPATLFQHWKDTSYRGNAEWRGENPPDGALVTRTNTALEVIKAGFEQFVAESAADYGLLYGLATALFAVLIGWFASVVFRRD